MRKALKWIGLTLAGLVVVLVVAAGALFLLFDWNWFKDTIVARASEATGRQVVIDNIEGTRSLVPRIRMTGVRIANADWAADRAKNMISVEAIEFRIELLELLRGRMVLPEVNISGAQVFLAKREDGTPNWKLGPSVAGAAVEASVPQERTEFPVVGTLEIDDSRLDYLDPATDIDITVGIASVDAEGGEERAVRVTGKGTYKQERFEVALTAGELLDLREDEKPYPLDLSLRIGETRFAGSGTARHPLDFDGLDFKLKLTGGDLADLFPITGIPLPPTDAYSLTGHLTRQQDIWSFNGFDGRVGDSDLGGDLTLDFRKKVPFMKADFTSDRLDFHDLGGFIGAPPDEEIETKGRDRVLPDMDIRLDRLHAMNMRVEFTGKEIIAPNLPIREMRSVLTIEDGQLTIDPVEFRAAGGSLSGPLVLDGREKIPAVRTDLMLKGMKLKAILDEFGMGEMTTGTFGGRITLSGRGTSLADVLGSADGRVTVAMSGGTVSPLLVELLGLDIAEALAVAITEEDRPVRIRCAVGALDAGSGTLQSKAFVFDTEDSVIWIGGSVDLRDERLAVRVRADPKDPSLLSANAPIAISGPLGSPNVAIDTLGTEGEGGAAEAIGKILNPVLALLPFFDVGTAEDIDCGPFEPRQGNRRRDAE